MHSTQPQHGLQPECSVRHTTVSHHATIVHEPFHKHSAPHDTTSSSRPGLCYLLSRLSSTDTGTHTHSLSVEARRRSSCGKILRWTTAIASPGLFRRVHSSAFEISLHGMPWRRCRCLQCEELRCFLRRGAIPKTMLVLQKEAILFQVTGGADDLDIRRYNEVQVFTR